MGERNIRNTFKASTGVGTDLLVKSPVVRAKYRGILINAALTGFFLFITPYLVMRKRMAPKEPAMLGAITQAAKTWETPFHPQFTPSAPMAAMPTPITPPTIL